MTDNVDDEGLYEARSDMLHVIHRAIENFEIDTQLVVETIKIRRQQSGGDWEMFDVFADVIMPDVEPKKRD